MPASDAAACDDGLPGAACGADTEGLLTRCKVLAALGTLAAVSTVVSLWSVLVDFLENAWLGYVSPRPLFPTLLVGTFLWWFVLGRAGWMLWRQRRRLADVCLVMPLVLASWVMYFFYTIVRPWYFYPNHYEWWRDRLAEGPLRSVLDGLPWTLHVPNAITWNYPGIGKVFGLCVLAFTILFLPITFRSARWTWRSGNPFHYAYPILLLTLAALLTAICLILPLEIVERGREGGSCPCFRPSSKVVLGVFLWWLILLHAARALWRWRRRFWDVALLAPAILASIITTIFNYQVVLPQGDRPSVGFPLAIHTATPLSYGTAVAWHPLGIVGNFLIWLAGCAALLVPVILWPEKGRSRVRPPNRLTPGSVRPWPRRGAGG